jgi:hypothetical protein
METKIKLQSICFAYFGDGKFLGWYADSFGSIRRNQPKLYTNSAAQIEVVFKNFNNKLRDIHKTSDISKHDSRLVLVDESLNNDADELSQYSKVELRVVECPYYDGPNPDYDKAAYNAAMNERYKKMVSEGITDTLEGEERFDAIEAFDKKNPRPKCDNWIYADFALVKVWAEKEPTEFLNYENK